MPTLNLSVLCSPGFEPALISRIAVYGPVCTVVWEGGAVRLLPIPMGGGFVPIKKHFLPRQYDFSVVIQFPVSNRVPFLQTYAPVGLPPIL